MFNPPALTDRSTPIEPPAAHAVHGVPLTAPVDGACTALFGLGCFWGAERRFWTLPGVITTAVGYAGGRTTHPTYEDVCTGRSEHAEVVRVVFDPARITFDHLLVVFFEAHNPTQGDRQGNDRGSQYRSVIFTTSAEQQRRAEACRAAYGERLQGNGHPPITTEVAPAPVFYYAEAYHQQYLHKNPGGYCGLSGTGVSCSPEG
jgi:peptide-methionine (S)-S-oxide reductase